MLFSPAGLQGLLTPHDPIVNAVEQTLARGHEWSRTAAPVAERIAVCIAGAIVRDHLQPGMRLPEKEISAELGVSRAPTREALRILERERLVDFQARRGSTVARLDGNEAMEIFAVRSALHEILYAELMCDMRSELEGVLAQHLPTLDLAASSAVDTYVMRSYLLNLAIIDLSGNRLIADLLTSVALRTLRNVRLGYQAKPDSMVRSLHGWHAIHGAVVLGDAERVIAAVQARTDEVRHTALDTVLPLRQLAA